MTGWEAVIEWSAGGPNRFVNARVGGLKMEPGTFCVTIGLYEPRGDYTTDAVYEHAYAGTLDEAAAAALAAWRKRML